METIDSSVVKFMAEQNKLENVKTVHARFFDKAGRCVVIETGERMPYSTHPVHHHFYFGTFTAEQAEIIATTLKLTVKLHAG